MRYLVPLVLTALLSVAVHADGHGGLANPNLIDAADLTALPHVDQALADAIVAGRPYLDAQQLDDVVSAQLDESQRAELYGRLFRRLNLNSAPESEILLIPGMNGKMAHEFEEYRPYSSMDQFRREIGKYVSEEEVARLAQYVFIPVHLNEGAEDDFKQIPGMTPKMVHEFEEYQPYENMEEFRREIGKYVDEDEVARLESYVTLD
jgi:DNA uptake protein ComE-like DNA-binding protein